MLQQFVVYYSDNRYFSFTMGKNLKQCFKQRPNFVCTLVEMFHGFSFSNVRICFSSFWPYSVIFVLANQTKCWLHNTSIMKVSLWALGNWWHYKPNRRSINESNPAPFCSVVMITSLNRRQLQSFWRVLSVCQVFYRPVCDQVVLLATKIQIVLCIKVRVSK